MKTEAVFLEGKKTKPLVIFIHGMGMDANMWVDPSRARVLGGKYPLSILLGGRELRNSFHDLGERGFPVLTWSQKRPAGPALAALEELRDHVRKHGGLSSAGIILIGHSRGGLIARRYLAESAVPVRAIITVGTPHHGSSMAKWVSYISPLAAALKKIIEAGQKKEVRSALLRVATFLSGSGVKEMLPGSDFLRSLSDELMSGTRTVSIGGTDPSLVKIGATSLPALLAGVIPEKMMPDEMREGRGDGFVSAESAVYPNGDEHRNFHAHHAGLIFDRDVREYIVKVVTAITS